MAQYERIVYRRNYALFALWRHVEVSLDRADVRDYHKPAEDAAYHALEQREHV